MSNKDNQLIAEAYELKLLKEGVLSSGLKAFLQPLFNNLFVKIKEKQPEAFAKLIEVNTPQELIDLINSYKQSPGTSSPQQQSEGMQDVVAKIKQALGALINKLDVVGNIGLIFAGLGSIIEIIEQVTGGAPNYGMVIAGLMMVAIKFAVDAGYGVAAKLKQ